MTTPEPRDATGRRDEVDAWLARARPEQLRRLIDDIRAADGGDARAPQGEHICAPGTGKRPPGRRPS